ncbi:hypothetical protein POK33_14135 [Burkholderia cenocepacia]|uniref:hypothetical protein n=1 Tax=Burkholderia cenocepacia TaxID=95486 RepID=UPI0023BA25D3|nr:hypothetical protein [Burkholderia cenocepacia]MDF0501863.1 hypothetical protein [Burkholderia cenocepacia]
MLPTNRKTERPATPGLGAERTIGSRPHSQGRACESPRGSVTVDDMSRRRMRPSFVPTVDASALSGTIRFLAGQPPAKRSGEPPSASRVSYLRVVKRARALRINP